MGVEAKNYDLIQEENNFLEEANVLYDLKERTKVFAYKCYDLCILIPESYINRNFKSQLVRCSSSVAANYRAACVAQSPSAFIAKISIVLEEIDESSFWLKFILDKEINTSDLAMDLYKEAGELTAIFKRSRLTARSKMK